MAISNIRRLSLREEASLVQSHSEWAAELGVRLQPVWLGTLWSLHAIGLPPVPRHRCRVAVTGVLAEGPGVGLWGRGT